ncbi:MAG: ABC transporter permease [Halorhabdus sp.]
MSTATTSMRDHPVVEFLASNDKVIFAQSIVLFLLVWLFLSHGLGLQARLSSPELVAMELYNLVVSMKWVPHVRATLRRLFLGFAVSLFVGTTVGVVLGMGGFWEDAFQDIVILMLAIPSLAIAIYSAMMFGFSDLTTITAAAIVSFPFVSQNIYEGVKDIDNELLEMGSAFNVSRERVFKRVIFQSILPQWFAGARYAFAISWKATVLAEYIVADVGMGYILGFQMQRLSLAGVLKWIFFFLMVIMFIEYGIFQQIEKRVFDWRQEASLGFM